MALVREYQSSAIPHGGWKGSLGGGKNPLEPLCFKLLLSTGGDILTLL